MSDPTEDDDYLSDKFIVGDTSAVSVTRNQSVTYTERRRQALRVSEARNVQNRKKNKRQLEEESLKEGLSKNLFEGGLQNGGNKAIDMMLKMGYKLGQSLGPAASQKAEGGPGPDTTVVNHGGDDDDDDDDSGDNNTESKLNRSQARSEHLVEPIRVELWTGREGLGKRKRNVSPTVAAKLAKLVKQDDYLEAEQQIRGSYRERAIVEYEEKRAEGRLRAARLTCITLDEKAGKKFNVYWLDPQDPETFPLDLLEILTSQSTLLLQNPGGESNIQEERLRRQMQADALQPLTAEADGLMDDDEVQENVVINESELIRTAEWPHDVLEQVRRYISANAPVRLKIILEYLRSSYLYCFWCGTKYEDAQDLEKNCPGLEEEDHD